MKRYASIILVLALVSCGGKKEDQGTDEADRAAVEMLQGVWLDDNTEMPILKVKGDSMYLASQVNAPFRFGVSGDTLISYGAEKTAYRIQKLGEHVLQFYTSMGDLMSLHKAETDTIPFGYEVEEAAPEPQVIQKDSVFMYEGNRYRGYAYINPSTKKVIRPGITDEGLKVDNVFYDNVIHICVYQGTRRLYSKDITKEMFAGSVPDNFLRGAILSDMDFMGVDVKGYHYRATICIPDGSSCYYVDLLIDREDNLTYMLKQ